MTAITAVRGVEVLDSRGDPTVEVDVLLEDGSLGRTAVPSGASTGTWEAVELRDGNKSWYHGKGVRKAVDGEIADAVVGLEAEAQAEVDRAIWTAPRTRPGSERTRPSGCPSRQSTAYRYPVTRSNLAPVGMRPRARAWPIRPGVLGGSVGSAALSGTTALGLR